MRVQPSPLRWALGLYCATIGALMLVGPHQFSGSAYTAMRPYLAWWGGAFLVAGWGLFGSAAFFPRRSVQLAIHGLTSAILLASAVGFASSGAWIGLTFYSVLAVAVASAAFCSPPDADGIGPERDLLSLAAGAAAALIGASMLLLPDQFRAATYDQMRPYLPWYGAAFLTGGLALLAAQLNPRQHRGWSAAAHLYAGVAFLAFALVVALPLRSWTGMLLYGGAGVTLLIVPWLRLRSRRDAGSTLPTLRLRLGLALCAAATLPLILAVASHSQREEDAVAGRELALRRSEAAAIARDIGIYVNSYTSVAISVGRDPSRLSLSPPEQTALLRSLSLVPEPVAVATFDVNGRGIARRDNAPISDITELAVFRQARTTGKPAAVFMMTPESAKPVLAVVAPVFDAGGVPVGFVFLQTDQLLSFLTTTSASPASRIVLFDQDQRATGVPGTASSPDAAGAADAAGPGVVQLAALSSFPFSADLASTVTAAGAAGARAHGAGANRWLAGYAKVSGVNWWVLAEQPAAVALADVRRDRDLAFGALLLAASVAVTIGVLSAHQLARPLTLLAAAMQRLSTGESNAPLPRSHIAEVSALAANFAEMRERIVARTAEVVARGHTIAEQASRLESLDELARLVGGTLDLASVGNIVVEQTGVRLGCRATAIHSYDAAEDRLRFLARWIAGRGVESYPPGEWSPDEHAVGPAVRQGTVHVVHDTTCSDEVRDQVAARMGMGSLASVPIFLNGAIWGALSVSFSEPGATTPDRVAFLEAIAAHLAIAVHNASLYSDLRQAHEELSTAQEQVIQQERLRALGEMASGIAHDFNNALAPVVGFSDLLLERAEALTDTVKAREYVSLINVGARDASGVVARLREFYRHRDPTDVPDAIELPAFIEQVVALTQPKWKDQAQAGGRTIAMVTEIRETPPVACDAGELREVLTNLIFNAVDAMPHGGTITLRARPDQAGVVLEVSDTGQGMTDEVRLRCLEPFFTTKGERGTGLGLAMVHGTLQRHHGRLEIESAPGQGTTFRIWLPSASDRTLETALLERDRQRPLRVLVVDDDPSVRAVTVAYFEADGHVVHSASSGREALAVAQAGTFDLMVTDQAMPGMSGDQLAAAVKHGQPDLPVILLTGFGDLMAASGNVPDGVDLVLGKPVTLARLREAVAVVLAPTAPATAPAGQQTGSAPTATRAASA